jgi:hypothetical protein
VWHKCVPTFLPKKKKTQDEFYSYIRETTLLQNNFLFVTCMATFGRQDYAGSLRSSCHNKTNNGRIHDRMGTHNQLYTTNVYKDQGLFTSLKHTSVFINDIYFSKALKN